MGIESYRRKEKSCKAPAPAPTFPPSFQFLQRCEKDKGEDLFFTKKKKKTPRTNISQNTYRNVAAVSKSNFYYFFIIIIIINHHPFSAFLFFPLLLLFPPRSFPPSFALSSCKELNAARGKTLTRSRRARTLPRGAEAALFGGGGSWKGL